MALDNYWMLNGEVYYLDFEPKLHLCGGILSGYGSGSFRGEVYAELIEEKTGYSLYQDLNQEQIKDIADKLEKVQYDEVEETGIYQEEFEDLKRMFREYSKIDRIELHAWYWR